MSDKLRSVDLLRITLNREGLAVSTLRKKHLATIKNRLTNYSLTESSPRELTFEVNDCRIVVDNNRINVIGRPRVDVLLRHAEDVLKALDSRMVGVVSMGFASYTAITSIERYEAALVLVFPEGKPQGVMPCGGERQVDFEVEFGKRRFQVDLNWDKPEAQGRLWILYDAFLAKPMDLSKFRAFIEQEHINFGTLSRELLGTYDLKGLVGV